MTSTFLLSAIFFFSGFSALVYQVVWQRVLTIHYGVGAVSITLIVSLFMAGLGVGAWVGGLVAECVANRRRVYALLELGIGLFGASSFWILTWLGRHSAGSPLPLAFLYVALFLLIPTTLMGMTLPLLTNIYNAEAEDFALTISHLYFINTLGAAAGSLVTAYVLITFGGLDTALGVASILNVLMAAAMAWASMDHRPAGRGAPDNAPELTPVDGLLKLVFVTGFLAIGYEILWYRFLGVLVKESAYAFATILAVYLAGLGVGSLWMSSSVRRYPSAQDRMRLLFHLQFGIGGYVLLSVLLFYYLAHVPPVKWLQAASFAVSMHPPAHVLGYESWSLFPHVAFWRQLARDLFVTFDIVLWPAFFMFIPTCLMGATFPLVSLLHLTDDNEEASTVARVYAWTIAGNVLGGIATGFVFLPYLGTEWTFLLFTLGGMLYFFPHRSGLSLGEPAPRSRYFFLALGLTACLLFPRRKQLYNLLHPNFDYGQPYIEEGREGVVVTFARGERVVNFINGLIHGGRPNFDFMQEALETLIYAQEATRVLAIGYGSGEVSDTALRSAELKELVVVELNHTLMRNLRKIPLLRQSLSNPRLTLVMDDGRRYLHRENDLFDAILMDPVGVHGTVYSNNLYSRQFFELAKSHLKPGGTIMVWFSEPHTIPSTVAAVFPHVRLYNHYCIASMLPMVKNEGREQALLSTFNSEDRANILAARVYVGDKTYFAQPGHTFPINEDWKPRGEYYLGLR